MYRLGREKKKVKVLKIKKERVAGNGGTYHNPNTWKTEAGRPL